MTNSHILAADGLDNIIRGRSEELSDDGELVDVVLAWKQRLAFEHLGKDAASAPNIHFHIVLLPGKHDLRGSIISRRNVTRHLWVLDPSKAEIANLQITIFVDQDVAGLEISVNDTGRVDIFETSLATGLRPRH
jgi:hypothetical protein